MCIERLPPSSFSNSGTINTDNIPTEGPEIIEPDYDDVEELYLDTEYNAADESDILWNDYMWMENEQEFEQEEIRRLEEEELSNQCMIAMSEMLLLDEIRQVEDEQDKESFLCDIAQKSSLNPFAEEFFPADGFFSVEAFVVTF